jgi:two-component system response regulator PilR (NtrC family)
MSPKLNITRGVAAEDPVSALHKLLLLRVIVLSFIFGAAWLTDLTGGTSVLSYRIYVAVAATYAISVLNAIALSRWKSHTYWLACFQFVTDAFLATAAVFLTNSYVCIVLYLLTILSSAIVADAKLSLILAALGSCGFALGRGWTADEFSTKLSTLDILLIYSFMIVFSLISSYISTRFKGFVLQISTQDEELSLLGEQQKILENQLNEREIDVNRLREVEAQLKQHEQLAEMMSHEEALICGVTSDNLNPLSQIIGSGPMMQKLLELIRRVASSDTTVMIVGESGTGKEVIARAIHICSNRVDMPFVAINCGAIPESLIESELFGHKKGSFTGAIADNLGLFRQADGGTLFLDEIGELPLRMQVKLLRALQERMIRPVGDTKDYPVDVRVISATNRSLKQEIAENHFREDLYYRLNVLNIVVPPLRDRKEDIPALVSHIVRKLKGDHGVLPIVSPEALKALMEYSYPGNIRELENIVERALVMGGAAILPEHLPEDVLKFRPPIDPAFSAIGQETKIITLPVNLEDILSEIERHYLSSALAQTGGAKKKAADLLGLNFRSFRYRVKKYGLAGHFEGDFDDNQ